MQSQTAAAGGCVQHGTQRDLQQTEVQAASSHKAAAPEAREQCFGDYERAVCLLTSSSVCCVAELI